jgi:hypothetical protein
MGSSLCLAPKQPSPKKTHRRRQQLDWGRCGVCLLGGVLRAVIVAIGGLAPAQRSLWAPGGRYFDSCRGWQL